LLVYFIQVQHLKTRPVKMTYFTVVWLNCYAIVSR
jgi:hypothetical protein